MCRAPLISLLVVSMVQAAAPPIPPPERILSTLRPGHPRLIVLDEHVARTKTLIETDPAVRRMRDDLKAAGEKILKEPPVERVLVGPRLLAQSRLVLNRVYTLAALYRLQGDARFAQRAEQEMLAAAAFPDWNPRHFLDTAEMTNALGIGYDWLYDVLSPAGRAAIRKAIVEKGLQPAMKVYERKSSWSRGTNNWNQVCNGGIAVGALAVADQEPALAGAILAHAAASIRRPIATLAPDGGWDEGPGYWNYGMNYTAYYVAAMYTVLGTDFGLTGFKGMAETGMFRIHSVGPGKLLFNYGDCSRKSGTAQAMALFAQLFDRPVYAYHYRATLRDPGALELFWYNTAGTREDLLKLPLDALFRNVDVAFLRSSWEKEAIYVGFKGGNNQASHAHLDLGTFVLDAAERRWAVDLGPDDYNLPGYFGSDRRWSYYRLRTEGHNTLLINGQNQELKAKAPIVAFKSTPKRAFAVADVSAAYAQHATKVRRGVALLDRQVVVIQDEIEATQPLDVQWLLHTEAGVKIDGQDVLLQMKKRYLRIHAAEAAGGTWSVAPVKIDPPQHQERTATSRLSLRFKTASPRTRVVIELYPTKANEPPRPPAPVRALAEWK